MSPNASRQSTGKMANRPLFAHIQWALPTAIRSPQSGSHWRSSFTVYHQQIEDHLQGLRSAQLNRCNFAFGFGINILKTAPTPDKNSSYGIKVGVWYAIKVGSYTIYSVRESLYFKGLTTLILWHLLGAYFLLIWGVGVVKIVFTTCRGSDK